MLTNTQKERYNRHIILPEIGEEGQKKLIKANVLVVGAGGLGAPVLQYLTAAGIGTIGIVDVDTVSLSNLQRQILFKEDQCDDSKAQKAKEFLQALNGDVVFNVYEEMLTNENAERIIADYDIVVGATDNFLSRKIINQITGKHQIPFVHGSIQEFQGQVTVFNYQAGPGYSDLFPETPEESTLPLGVLGVLPGVVGSLQACEVIKIITGIGDVLSGKLLVYDALKVSFTTVDFC